MGNTFRREDIHAQYLLPSRRNGVSAWDNEIVRRMVLDRKLAPFYPGAETNHECPDAEECPICFLYYRGGLNRSRCCKKPICTECYLQICAPDAPHTSCPFCMRPGYSVRYCGPLSHREIEAMRLEEERVTQLQLNAIRSQNESSPRPNVQSPQTSRTDAGAGQERAAPSPLMHDMGNLSELERYMIAEAVRRSLLEVSGTSVLLDLEDGDEESINAEWMSQVLVENPNIRTQHERSRTSPGPSHQQRVCSGAQSSDQGPSFYQDPELFYDLPEQRTSSNRTLHPEDFLPDVLENIPQVLRNQFSLHKYKNVQRKNPPPADSVGPTMSTVQDESRVRIHSQSQGNRPPPNPNRLTLPPPLQNTTIDDLLGILSSERRRSLPQYLLQVGPSNQGTEPRGNHPN